MKKFLFIAAVSVMLFSCGKPKNYEQQKSDFVDVYMSFKEYVQANLGCRAILNANIEYMQTSEASKDIIYGVVHSDSPEVEASLDLRVAKFNKLKNDLDAYQAKYGRKGIEKFEKYYAKEGGVCTVSEITDTLMDGHSMSELSEKYYDLYEGLTK